MMDSEGDEKKIRRNKFSQEEDYEITRLVAQFGSRNWGPIADAVGNNRTKRQVRERWMNYLDPQLKNSYSPAEDAMLERLYDQYGQQWARIALEIGNKSAISVRNRHRKLQSAKARGLQPMYSTWVDPINPPEIGIIVDHGYFPVDPGFPDDRQSDAFEYF
jgi:myb proto-oncogene protein